MKQADESLFQFIQQIEEDGHYAAIFLRGATSFVVKSARIEGDWPGVWVCETAAGQSNLMIDFEQVTAVVEHEQLPSA